MKLYTRTGDDGTTGLTGGRRVAKDARCMEAIGAVDELNCILGLAQSVCRHAELTPLLGHLQNGLFELGADLAAPESAVTRIATAQIDAVEKEIDTVCAHLLPMQCFILPGGGELGARLHLARAVCRRAERRVVALGAEQSINPHAAIYLNRISDLLFAMARRASQCDGIDDVPWEPVKR